MNGRGKEIKKRSREKEERRGREEERGERKGRREGKERGGERGEGEGQSFVKRREGRFRKEGNNFLEVKENI